MLLYTRRRRTRFIATLFLLAAVVLVFPVLQLAILVLLAAALVLFLFYPVFIYLNKRRYRLEEHYNAAYYITTIAGYELALFHYRARGAARPKYPIVLCHGIAANHRFFDMTESNSLALFLSRLGFDVYSVDLRGCGLSRATGEVNDFNFDDLVSDVPHIIEAVLQNQLRIADAPAVIWLGHSLGAMIMYKHLEQNPDDRRIAAFCSLAGLTQLSSLAHPVITDFLRVSKYADKVDLVRAGQLFAPFAGLFRSRYDDFLYNKDAMNRPILRRLMTQGVSNVAPALSAQLLAAMVQSRSVLKFNLEKIKKPILMMTGAKDNLCTPLDLQYTFETIGTKPAKKAMFILGKLHGFSEDYCHGSIVLGKNADDEVFSLIARWLKDFN